MCPRHLIYHPHKDNRMEEVGSSHPHSGNYLCLCYHNHVVYTPPQMCLLYFLLCAAWKPCILNTRVAMSSQTGCTWLSRTVVPFPSQDCRYLWHFTYSRISCNKSACHGGLRSICIFLVIRSSLLLLLFIYLFIYFVVQSGQLSFNGRLDCYTPQS